MSSMVSHGPLAITTAVVDSGIRLYTKFSDGTVITESISTTQQEVEAAQQNDNKEILQEVGPWSRQSGTYRCEVASALATHAIDGGVAIFHEHDGQIKYWFDNRSFDGNLSTQTSNNDRVELPRPSVFKRSCLSGTQIAVVGNDDGSELNLFYQDTEGNLCVRNFENSVWEEPVVLCKMAERGGIAAIRWSNDPEIRVYYQDENHDIYERASSRNTWVPSPALIVNVDRLTTISAVHWASDQVNGNEIRLYYQVGPSRIEEKGWTSGLGWRADMILFEAFVAEFNVHVFLRGEPRNPVINLWMASKEGQVLIRRAYNRKSNGWIPAIGHSLPLTGAPY